MAYWGSLETHKPRYFYPRQLLYLHVQFTSQSAPDIHRKLHQLEKGPKTPQWDFLEIAFKVFNNSESEVAQSCPILWDPMDCRLPHPWNFLGKSTGVGCHFLLHIYACIFIYSFSYYFPLWFITGCRIQLSCYAVKLGCLAILSIIVCLS